MKPFYDTEPGNVWIRGGDRRAYHQAVVTDEWNRSDEEVNEWGYLSASVWREVMMND